MYLILSSSKRFNSLVKNNKFLSKKFILLTKKKFLNINYLNKKKIKKIFVPYWNYRIPKEIYKIFEVYGFHSTPLPFGRGGSPVQNMIIRGYQFSTLCSFKLNGIIDSGDIYLKKRFSLKGKGQTIFEKIDSLIIDMILKLIKYKKLPTPQVGKITYFKRRNGKNNELPTKFNLTKIYDHIRMLDIKDHPKSNLKSKDTNINFFDPKKFKNHIIAKVKIEKIK